MRADRGQRRYDPDNFFHINQNIRRRRASPIITQTAARPSETYVCMSSLRFTQVATCVKGAKPMYT
jgi:hypothetical protein